MIKTIQLLLLLLPVVLSAQSPDNEILKTIQQNQILSFGGCGLIQVEGKTYLAGVSAVEVGTKKISLSLSCILASSARIRCPI